VAGGLARRTGFDPTLVRVVVVLAALMSGIGAVGYVVAWLLLPLEGEPESIGARAVSDRVGLVIVAALLPVLVAVLLVSSATGSGVAASVAWALYLVAGGTILIYRNAAEDERSLIRRSLSPVAELGSGSRRTLVLRLVLGLLLLGVGVGLVVRSHVGRAGLDPLAAAGLLAAAVVVVFGPWWLRLARDLVAERQARVRAEERADMAARVHDSVLQTLALIQRQAADPDAVVSLARAQERELREWLFEGRPPGALGDDRTLTAAVRRMAREVESAHGVSVEVVTVGDAALDDDLSALVAAGREAVVNAARWSGVTLVAVYAEAAPDRVELFVRDRGKGFDPDAVPPGHQGIAASIRGRMARAGGTAEIRSRPGEGTEVALSLTRTPQSR
jgi:signal transduction histidine kinase/phage shock protein PspC (stress-responsive transcriptional regulator)